VTVSIVEMEAVIQLVEKQVAIVLLIVEQAAQMNVLIQDKINVLELLDELVVITTAILV
jgi:hypothetical protein